MTMADLNQQAAESDDVYVVFAGLFDDGLGRHLDADVVHLVAIVAQDDVHEVFADVVHVTLNRGQQDLGGVTLVDLFHEGFQKGHGLLHGLG